MSGRTPVPSARAIASAAHCSASSEAPRSGGEQRAAALVRGEDQQLAVRGLGPLVEQARCGPPVAGAQLELAHLQSLQGIRDRLVPFVGERQQPGQDRPRAAHLAAPHEPLAQDALGRLRDVVRGVRRRIELLAQLVDRAAPHAARPGQLVERKALRVRPRAPRGRQRLQRQRLGLGDPLHGAAGGVAGLSGQHVRAHLRIALALGQRGIEMALEVLPAPHVTALGEQQPCARPRRAARQRIQLRRQQVREPLRLACRLQVAGEGEQPLRASG